jgi:hypothetical protein
MRHRTNPRGRAAAPLAVWLAAVVAALFIAAFVPGANATVFTVTSTAGAL